MDVSTPLGRDDTVQTGGNECTTVTHQAAPISVGTAIKSIVTSELHNRGDINISQGQKHPALEPMIWYSSLSSFDHFETMEQCQKILSDPLKDGKWILEEPLYREWRYGGLKRLWCCGPLGVGKTVLSTVLITHLQDEISSLANDDSNKMVCIYAHIKHQQSEKMSILGFLVSLLIQLVSASNECYRSMKEFWERHAAFPQPNHKRILDLLKGELGRFKTVFLVLDGVDEWPVEGLSCSLPNFISVIRGLLLDNVKLLITSGQNPLVQGLMHSGKQMEIWAHDGDLRRYIEARINRSPSGSTLVTQTAKNEQEICDDLVKQSRGVFLLAQIQMDVFNTRAETLDLGKSLKDLPTSCVEFYQKSVRQLSRELSQASRSGEQAKKILTWICFANHRFQKSELEEILSENIDGRDIISACVGLITLNDDDTVQLIHLSAKEYLTKPDDKCFLNDELGHSYILEKCLGHLLSGQPERDSDSEQSLNEPTEYFLPTYAANHLGFHFRSARKSERINELIRKFFKSSKHFSRSLQLLKDKELYEAGDATPLHLAAHFASKGLIKLALQVDPNPNPMTKLGKTPLYWAVMRRQPRVAQALLSFGANPNLADLRGKTPLHLAIMNSHEEIVTILLKASIYPIDLERKTGSGYTALRLAAKQGELAIIKSLLEHSVDVDAEHDGFPAIKEAFEEGHNDIVILLAKSRARMEDSNPGGWSVLCDAASVGDLEIARILVANGANPSYWNKDGHTPLFLALMYGYTSVASLLLEKGGDINAKNQKGQTVLHCVMEKYNFFKNKSLIWLLLEKGADVEAYDNDGSLPLHVAAGCGADTKGLWLLLAKGADCSGVDNGGKTALHHAAKVGNVPAIRLLLEFSSNIEAVTATGQTPLHAAATGGHEQAVEFLLSRGGNINAVDNNNKTALHWAVRGQSKPTAEMLLLKGADVNAKDVEGMTALHMVALTENKLLADLLLRHGARIDERDESGCSPLKMAIGKRNNDMVGFLQSRRQVRFWGQDAQSHTAYYFSTHNTLLDE